MFVTIRNRTNLNEYCLIFGYFSVRLFFSTNACLHFYTDCNKHLFGINWPQELTITVADPGFSRGEGANPKSGCKNLLFGQIFPENCMKMKEIGPRGGGGRVPGTPFRSATE